MIELRIQNNDANQTIFKFIKKVFSTTPLSVIEKWFRKEKIQLNSQKIKDKKTQLQPGDIIEIDDNNQTQSRDHFKYVAKPVLDIIYEDPNILIVNKEPNLEVHSCFNLSLDDIVKSYLVNTEQYNPKFENSFVISHVHRLDKLTSGLVIYAKNKISLNILTNKIISHHSIEKHYWAMAESRLWPSELEINCEGWIGYDSQKQVAVYSLTKQKDFKSCHTRFQLLKKTADTVLLDVQLITGRKHQIRATLAFLGCPILNDYRYRGKPVNSQKRIYLEAYKISFKDLPVPLNYLNDKIFELHKCSFK